MLPFTSLETLKEARTVMQGARELITDPEHWTQGALTRTAVITSGGFLGLFKNVEEISQYCMIGAVKASLYHIVYGYRYTLTNSVRRYLEQEIEIDSGWSQPVECFNDSGVTTHRYVLNIFDRAIKQIIKDIDTLTLREEIEKKKIMSIQEAKIAAMNTEVTFTSEEAQQVAEELRDQVLAQV